MQGKGIDTKMMVPAYVLAFTALSMIIKKSTFSMIEEAYNHTVSLQLVNFSHTKSVVIILSVLVMVLVLILKDRAVNYVRVYGVIYALFFSVVCVSALKEDVMIPSILLGQFILTILITIYARKLLDPMASEAQVKEYVHRTKIGIKTMLSIILCLVAVPVIIYFGFTYLNDRAHIFTGLMIIGISMVPFFTAVEEKNPPARELILIAVMSAIAVVGRMAFFMIPQFKPMTAVVIISAIGLGPQAGFLTGVVTAFVSNFFFGQGPWTPWQMFSLGIIGFIAGLIFYKKVPFEERDRVWRIKRRIVLCIYGGLSTLIIYGFIMDTASVLTFQKEVTKEMFLAAYVSGFPFNVIHAVSTVIFLLVMSQPIERKLDRIQKKFGI